jgi:hypothetical protein
MEKQGKRLNLNLESSKKGQALVELAIFGSILLFCLAMLIQYGLDANYQQQAQMEAFRKTQKLAFYKDGLGASTSLVIIKDKAMPDPRDQWGFAERQPIVGAGSVTWNTNLAATYVKLYTDTPYAQDLPTLYFEVDKANKPAEASAPVPSEAGNQVFGFYTARFEKLPCPAQIKVVFPNNDKSTNRTSEYITVTLNRSDIRVMRIEGGFGEEIDVYTDGRLLMQPYFRYNGMKYKISDADVDGDGKLETIIAADETKELFYVDSHETSASLAGRELGGDIQVDTDYTYIDTKDRIEGRPVTPTDKQGLLNDFEKTIQHSGTKITKTESGGRISSQTNIKAQQTVIHKIRLNNGQVLQIPANFRVDGNFYDWNN